MRRAWFLLLPLLAACADDDLTVVDRSFVEAETVCYAAPDFASVEAIDVMFVVDTTGSMGGAISNLREQLHELAGLVAEQVPRPRFGLARYDDFPCCGGFAEDRPYVLVQPLTSDIDLVAQGLASLTDEFGFPVGFGGDVPESSYEALYQVATGAGFDVAGDGDYDDPDDIEPGDPGWDPTALPSAVLVTDAEFRDPDAGDEAPAGAHGRAATIQALSLLGMKVIGINVGRPDPTIGPFTDMQAVAEGTATVSPLGFDYDGDGAYDAPGEVAPGGPLVFATTAQGEPLIGGVTLGQAVVDGLHIVYSNLDLTLEVHGDIPDSLTVAVEPNHFEVHPGEEVCFELHLEGELFAGEDRSYDFVVEVLGEDRVLLGTEEVTLEIAPSH